VSTSRPSLRRRLTVALAAELGRDYVVLTGIYQTIRNTWRSWSEYVGPARPAVHERGARDADAAAARAGLPASDRAGAGPGLPARPVSPFEPSLRRRVALALAVMFVLGSVILTGGYYLVRNLLWRATFESYDYYGSPGPVVRVFLLLLFVAVLALVVWSWWLVAGRLLRPLSVTAETVRQLGPQNLGQRIRLTGSDDALKELADAIDEALDRLAAGYEGQRRFAANASHELRTPLAVQRVLTEVAMDAPGTTPDLQRLGEQLLRTNERNEKLIEGLLVLAESDRGLPGKVPVRLDELVGSVLDAHAEMADRHQVGLRRTLSERLVPGDPVLLERLVGNLVTNAIRYNEPGGWVEVEVGSQPALTVRNSGQSVPAEVVSSLFEPFRRLTAERTNHSGGVGLGLSIARSITTAHDGTIRARPHTQGGLIVEIDLPQDSRSAPTQAPS
jgi:signal transduction histidine kinase